MFNRKCIDCGKYFKTSHRSDKRCRSCYKTWHKRKVYYTNSSGKVQRVKPLKKKKNYQKKKRGSTATRKNIRKYKAEIKSYRIPQKKKRKR